MKSKWLVLLLFLIVFISYGQTLRMYFLIDDNALIYKLQHINEPLGFWGAGAVGSGPYRHIVNQFVPFYPLFKVNPLPYFAVGLFLYFLTTLAVFWFAKALSKNKTIALLSAILYSAGYIGAESLFGIVNSWQTSRGIIMAIGAFYLYRKYIDTRRIVYYAISAVLFYLSLDTVYIRAHGLIFAIIIFDLLFWPVRFKLQSILSAIARLTPFAFIHYKIYLGSVAYAREFGIFSIISQIINEGKYYLATIPIQDIGSVFLPSSLSNFFGKFFEKYIKLHPAIELGTFVSGVIVILFFAVVVIKHFRKEPKLTKLVIFAFGWVIANFIMFYAREPLHTLWSTHRYLSYSFVGTAIFWSASLYLSVKYAVKAKYLYYLLFIAIFLSLIISSLKYQYAFNQRRSIPAKDLFNKFTQSVPKLKKGDVLYFDIANNSQISARFGSFFGGMFSEASNFAIYTEGIDYMNDFLFTYNFGEVLGWLSDGSLKLGNLYTFYYGQEGLVNTTEKTRDLLISGGRVSLSDVKINNSKILVLAEGDTPSFVPSKLAFTLKSSLKATALPYIEDAKYNVLPQDKKLVFSYLISKSNYYSTVKAQASSFWKEQSVDLLIDGRMDTAWRGHRGYWDEYFRGREKNETLTLDLGVVKRAGAIRWFTAQKPLIPSLYTISASLDKKIWVNLGEIKRNTELTEGSEVVDVFDPIDARYLKVDILNTIGNDGPEIKEMEVIESKYVNLAKTLVDKVQGSPFGEINSVEEYTMAANFVKGNSQIKIFWKSDADTALTPVNYLETKMTIDDTYHRYEIALPASGINWQEFSIEGFNFPADLDLKSIEIIYQPYEKK